METVLTSKGQMTLPIAIRRRLGLDSGDRLNVQVDEASGSIILKRAGDMTAAPLLGLLKKPAQALTLEEMDAAVGTHLAQKHQARGS